MNILLSFLPIIIILAVVIFVIFLTKTSLPKSIIQNHWVISGYIAILFISFGLTSFHPSSTIGKNVKVQDLEKENTNLYNAVMEGKAKGLINQYPNKKWSFSSYQGTQLNIELGKVEAYGARVVVKRKKINDHKIEVINFKSRASANGRELVAKPLGIKLLGNTLIIQKPKRLVLNYFEFKNVFSITQFTREQGIMGSSDFYEGSSLLYIKVPANVEVNDQSNIGIEYSK
ncbi:MAG: hypothetical protein Q8934_19925 [Bacillota bacterium]|nr:hypothetical protein [Bacillota bacterium]